MAVVAAVAGTGFASGRLVALCFSQMGRWSWPGIALAVLIFAGLIRASHVCARPGRAFRALRVILMGVVSALMLRAAARLGALALSGPNSALIGAVACLGLALAANCFGQRLLPGLGLIATWGCALFYAALALDPRPVARVLTGGVMTTLPCPPAMTVLLAAIFSGVNGSVALGTAREHRASGKRCALLLGAVLLCANAAVLSGSPRTLVSRAPLALLAARWGRPGFLLSAFLPWLCCACTLAAAVGDGLRALGDGMTRRDVKF